MRGEGMNQTGHVQLSEIASLITKGTTPTTIGYEFQDSGINFLKIECFDEYGNYIEPKVAHISGECHEKLKRSQLESGDILFSIAGVIGRVAIVTDEMLPANTNQALAIIRITREDVYLPYIKLILSSPLVKEQFEKKKQGVAQLNISLKDINELTIPLPELNEQIALTALFEKAAGIIAKRQQQLSALDDLIKARFIEMFEQGNYPQVEFGEICEHLRNGANIKQTKGAGGYPITRIETLANDVFNIDRLGYANIFELGKYENYLLNPGDILISHINSTAYLGRAVQYRGQMSSPIIHGMNLLCARIAKGYNPTYIEFFFKTPSAKEYISSITKKAVNQASITTSDLKKMLVPAPSLEKQNEFDQFVHQVDKSKSVIQKSLDETQLLFDSLMQKYFG